MERAEHSCGACVGLRACNCMPASIVLLGLCATHLSCCQRQCADAAPRALLDPSSPVGGWEGGREPDSLQCEPGHSMLSEGDVLAKSGPLLVHCKAPGISSCAYSVLATKPVNTHTHTCVVPVSMHHRRGLVSPPTSAPAPICSWAGLCPIASGQWPVAGLGAGPPAAATHRASHAHMR